VAILDIVVDHTRYDKSINDRQTRNTIRVDKTMYDRHVKTKTIVKDKLAFTFDNIFAVRKELLLLFVDVRGVQKLHRLTSVQVLGADYPDARRV
jgi:hypothetical protein